ncbi:MAG: T9SS type A sorting domain-containing protein [Bacteroidota bacterium]
MGHTFGSSAVNVDQGLGIVTDATSVYVVGSFGTSVSVNGSSVITGAGGIDGVIFKLNAATGATQWVTTFGGSSSDNAQAVCLDASGQLYVSGNFFGTATFGSFSRTALGSSNSDLFAARLNAATGAFDWVSTGGANASNDNANGSGICYLPLLNAVVVAGSCSVSTAIYATTSPVSSITLTASSGGAADICVLQLNAADGAFTGGLRAGGTSVNGAEEALGAVYDPSSQDVILTGYFNSTAGLTFGSNPAMATTGGDDIFYAGYDPVGNTFTWARGAGSTGNDRGLAIASNNISGILITGRFRGTFSAPTASSPLTVTTSRVNADDIFLLRINNTNGNAQLLTGSVGDNLNATSNQGLGIVANSLGKVWIAGSYASNIVFSPLASLAPSGTNTADIVLALFNDVITLPVNLISFTAQLASDDVQLKWLTANETDNDHFDIERSTDGRSFTSIGQRQGLGTGVSGNYNWIDPGIATRGAENIYYRLKIVSVTGEIGYSVIVVVNLNRNISLTALIGPNPFSDVFNIMLSAPRDGNIQISVNDMLGRNLYREQRKVAKGFSTLPVSAEKFSRGVYTLVIEFEGERVINKINKQ